eukprot:CAMPEP_0172501850 /NCGR_PEP_ID=MMETSP1066-20121228/154199_1 /TAXON_ID=671091 /ORGANISM="Coscinodiscus wailesii, Strain CCMP2513" /LENGTH=41 /DNA_ID= /DNA_START= /DNA_END= /DNA_ORIENTATION=
MASYHRQMAGIDPGFFARPGAFARRCRGLGSSWGSTNAGSA